MKNQNAFTAGGQILEVVMVANEVVEIRKSLKLCLVSSWTLKRLITLELFGHGIRQKGFGPRWRRKTTCCLATSTFFVINRKPEAWFHG